LKTATSPAGSDGRFPETQWTIVLEAGGPSTLTARRALDALCAAYWYPIYAFIRRKTDDAQNAPDLTQEYFCGLLKKRTLAAVDPSKGRFRAFLMTDCSHFLVDVIRRQTAGVRNPGRQVLSIDVRSAEGRYLNEPAHGRTAEQIFMRDWARTLIGRVLNLLKAEYDRAGKTVRFDQLKVVLTEHPRSIPYAEIAARLSTTEQAVATAVHSLRQRYKTILRREIADTVADPADVDDEICALLEALRS